MPDLLRLLEASGGVRVFGEKLGRNGPDGAYQLSQGIPFVLLNLSKSPQRTRFTLAHEYGHHRLGHGARAPETVMPGSRDPLERAANEFSAAFLMPRPAISRWFETHGEKAVDLESLCRLACDFGVSAKAMLIRLNTIERVGRTLRTRLDGLLEAGAHLDLMDRLSMPRIVDSVSQACERGVWLPPEFQKRLVSLLDREGFGADVVSRHLPSGVRVEDLVAWSEVTRGEVEDA
ncbi:MAG: ImmA/IrrE family metallo-endopeptidase [Actinobacteria bacterium]|nr:ImmA/IrrE family metallo-endopeptidase [Actinomycetota bacterium]